MYARKLEAIVVGLRGVASAGGSGVLAEWGASPDACPLFALATTGQSKSLVFTFAQVMESARGEEKEGRRAMLLTTSRKLLCGLMLFEHPTGQQIFEKSNRLCRVSVCWLLAVGLNFGTWRHSSIKDARLTNCRKKKLVHVLREWKVLKCCKSARQPLSLHGRICLTLRCAI